MTTRLSKVWKVNGMLVVANNYDEAIEIYKDYVKDAKIDTASEDGEYVLVRYN